jgi:hypothetical protein
VVFRRAVAPHASFVVSASEDRTLKVWHRDTGTDCATLRGPSPRSCSIVRSRFEESAVTACEVEDGAGECDRSGRVLASDPPEEVGAMGQPARSQLRAVVFAALAFVALALVPVPADARPIRVPAIVSDAADLTITVSALRVRNLRSKPARLPRLRLRVRPRQSLPQTLTVIGQLSRNKRKRSRLRASFVIVNRGTTAVASGAASSAAPGRIWLEITGPGRSRVRLVRTYQTTNPIGRGARLPRSVCGGRGKFAAYWIAMVLGQQIDGFTPRQVARFGHHEGCGEAYSEREAFRRAIGRGQPPRPQCSDGRDNDSDGKIDHPADPGCESAADDSESPDPSPPSQCSDGRDNDSDGKIDHPTDPGCESASDDTESPDPAPPACLRSFSATGWTTREWTIERLGASIPEDSFEARIDGTSIGATELLAFANRLGSTERVPQVLVIASSGYLRLKPGADPDPPLPFGQSLVLGPAVFGSSTSFPASTLFFNPRVQRVGVDTSQLGADCHGTLRIRIAAEDEGLPADSTKTNQIMDLAWDVALHEPSAEETQIEVSGSFTFTEQVTPDPTRTAEFQSFRLYQISSMFIDSDRHDVDAFRYRGASGPVAVAYTPSQAGQLLPAIPTAMDPQMPVLDSLHTDDAGMPNGDTPSYRITLGTTTGPMAPPTTPRAFFTATDDLNDDNLGLWAHQRPLEVIPAGTTGSIRFVVRATADPLPPF